LFDGVLPHELERYRRRVAAERLDGLIERFGARPARASRHGRRAGLQCRGSVPGRQAARRGPAVRQTVKGRRGYRPEARSPVPVGSGRTQGRRGLEGTNGLSKLFLTITAAFAAAERDRKRLRLLSIGLRRVRTVSARVTPGWRNGIQT